MQNKDNPQEDLLFRLLDSFITDADSLVAPKLPRAKIVIYEVKPREIKNDKNVLRYEIHKIGTKEIPFLDMGIFSLHAKTLNSYNSLYWLLKLITEYPDQKINLILLNIYSIFHLAKYIEGLPSEDILEKVRMISYLYYSAELLEPFIKETERLLRPAPTPDKWRIVFRRVAQQLSEKIKKKIPVEIDLSSFVSFDINKWLEEIEKTSDIKVPLRIRDFFQGISIEEDSKIHLGEDIYLRKTQPEDFSDRFYEIVDLTFKEKMPEYVKNYIRFTMILNNWEMIRPKYIYLPSSVVEIEKEMSFFDLSKTLLKTRVIPYAFNLYDVIFSRPVHEEIYLKLGEKRYIRLPLLELLSYITGTEEKNTYPFVQYRIIKPAKEYILKKEDINKFQVFIKNTANIPFNLLFNLLLPRTNIQQNYEISIIRILNSLILKNDAVNDETSIINTIVPLIASFEYLFSKPGGYTSSRKLSERIAKLFDLLGIGEPKEIMRMLKSVYNIRSKYLHGKLGQLRYFNIKQKEKSLPRIADLIRYLNVSLIIFLLAIHKGDTQDQLIDLINESMISSKVEIRLRNYLNKLINEHNVKKCLPHYFY